MQALTVVTAEVEVGQDSEPLGMPIRDLVQHLLHLRGEGVIDQLGEVRSSNCTAKANHVGTSAVPFLKT